MLSSEIIDEVAKRMGLSRDVVAKPIIDLGRNSFSLVCNDLVPSVNISPFGIFYFKSMKSAKELELKVIRLEKMRIRYNDDLNLGRPRSREIITRLIDLINAHFSQIIQNHVTNGQFKRGFNKKNDYDMDFFDALLQRFYTVLDNMPCRLARTEPSEVQKKTLRKLFAKKVYIDIPEEIDCPMWPMWVYHKGENNVYGLSLSTILLERDKWIQRCRKQGLESYLNSQANDCISR